MTDLSRINLRLNQEQVERLRPIVDKVKAKQKYAPVSDIVKELIGLIPYDLVSDKDRSKLLHHGNALATPATADQKGLDDVPVKKVSGKR